MNPALRLTPRLLAALSAAVLMASHHVAGAESVVLRYNLKPESTYDQTMILDMDIRMTMAGLATEQQAQFDAVLGKGMKQNMTMRMALRVGAQDADGSKPVETAFEDLKMQMRMGEQEVPVPTETFEKLRGMSIRGRVAADGRMIEMDMQNLPGAENVPKEFLDRLLQSLPKLPEKEMRIGDTLEIPQKMEMPIPMGPGAADMQIDSMTIFTLTKIEERIAHFDVRQTLSMGMTGTAGAGTADGAAPRGMKMSMTGGSNGTGQFDIEEGIFTSMRMQMAMQAEVEVAAPSGQPAPQTAPATPDSAAPQQGPVTMKMSMTGPVEVVYARRQVEK